MARFARLEISNFGGVIPHDTYIELTIKGQLVYFTSATISQASGNQNLFAQQTSGQFGPPVAANFSSLVTALQGYLQAAGITDYEVGGTYTTDSFVVSLKATAYSDALNFGPCQVVGHSATGVAVKATNDNPPSGNGNVSQVLCFSGSTGSILLDISGGQAPYAFQWSNGATTKDVSALPAGQYSVKVTDSARPQPLDPSLPEDSPYQAFSEDHPGVLELTFLVGQNAEIIVTGSVGNNAILLEVSGGTAPYAFLWSDGVTTKDRLEVTPGTYACTITDALGCSKQVSFTIVEEHFYFSKNPVLLRLQAESPETKPFLRFVCEVWVEPAYLSGEFILATPEPFEHPAEADGGTEFDVSEILDAFVEPHLPDFNQAEVKRADKAFKRFYLRYREVYGDPVTLSPVVVQDNRYVLCGGLEALEYYAQTYSAFKAGVKPFFTWEPTTRRVFTAQPEFLYFMPDDFSLTDFRVRVRVTFTDSSSYTYTAFTQAGIKRFELWCIPVGHDQLGLAALQPGKTVRSWQVWVIDEMNRSLSEIRTFVLNTKNYLHTRFVLFANSVGGYNTLAATGRGKYSLDADAQLVERRLPRNGMEGDSTVISKFGKPTLQLSTGEKSREEMHALQDFLISEDVQFIGPGRYIPARLGDRSVVISDDENRTPAFEFDLVLPKRYRYTPVLTPEGFSPYLTEES
ncbi:SprB repeat-containing protein [Pontibacter beigongshangensis]|uniref:SprB repeat-containing protein n=1 Tax=Pontibacter beigongshangensis TaxID=2574733 RepID=UPI00164EEE3E|nr:SprB repeat-containing protein [Pontibacter beigongshangensis]